MIVLWVLALVSQDTQEQAVSGVKESAQQAIANKRADDLYLRGIRKLDAGDNAGAIDDLSVALRERPDFIEAERAEARALLGLARQQEAAGNYGEARRLRAQARELDAGATDAPEYGAPRRLVKVPTPQLKPARKDKWLGINLNVGVETLVGIGLSVFVLQHFELVATIDTIKPAIDIDGKVLFLKSNWTPYLGFGGHISLLRNVVAPDFWQRNFLHIDAGLQYMHPSGFYLDLGLTWYPPAFGYASSPFGDSSGYYAIPLPHLAVGWAFEL
jgi:tetratricopeptide (TPR) repeat protein